MTIKDEDLLAAISSGIDQATTGDANAGNDTGGADNAGDDADVDADRDGAEGANAEQTADGDAAEGDEQAGGDASEDAGSEDGANAGGDEVDPATGKPKAKAGSEEFGEDGQPLTKEQKRAKEEADNAAAAKADPINAPVSPHLKPATQERMRSLIDIARTTTAERDRALTERNEIIQMVQDTGASAQQYSQMLHYLQAVNSRDPVQLREAVAFLQQELQHVARMSGVPVPGVNGYEAHADLKTAVDAKQITPELANEMAARRDGDQYQLQSRQQQQQMTERQQQEYAQAVADGKAALNAVGARLKTQPDYVKKAPLVLKQIAEELKEAHPSKWATIFLTAYTTFTMPAPPKPPVRKQGNQPLRGNNPSGGQQGAPKSLADAVNMGIARGTRA